MTLIDTGSAVAGWSCVAGLVVVLGLCAYKVVAEYLERRRGLRELMEPASNEEFEKET